MPSNSENQSSISKLPREVLLFFLSLLLISAFNILLVPPLAYELATFLLLNLSAETKEILLLLVNIAVQVLLVDKVKKQLQTVTTYEGYSWIFSSWVPETSPGIWVRTSYLSLFEHKIQVQQQVQWWDFSNVRKDGTEVMFGSIGCEDNRTLVWFALQDQTIPKEMSIWGLAAEFQQQQEATRGTDLFLKRYKNDCSESLSTSTEATSCGRVPVCLSHRLNHTLLAQRNSTKNTLLLHHTSSPQDKTQHPQSHWQHFATCH